MLLQLLSEQLPCGKYFLGTYYVLPTRNGGKTINKSGNSSALMSQAELIIVGSILKEKFKVLILMC